jgi:hypothetical protein
MASRSNRFAVLALSVLPAFGVSVPTRDAGRVASFFYACPEYKLPPRVHTKRYSKARLEPRTASWMIVVYEKGSAPDRRYALLGEVEVLAQGHKTTLVDLRAKAREVAEKLGGDALVELSSRDAGRTEPRIGEKGLFVLTAQVARWDDKGQSPPLAH